MRSLFIYGCGVRDWLERIIVGKTGVVMRNRGCGNNRSVLLFMGAWSVGGVEQVTAVLGNELVRRGWAVSIFAFAIEDKMLLANLDDRIKVVIPNAGIMSNESATILRKTIIDNHVGIVVNDWSLPFKTSLFLRRVCKGLNVRQVVNLHNIPNHNARIARTSNPILRGAIKLVSGINMHLTYLLCDKYVLLSPSFIPIFKRFAFVPFAKKLTAITNPLTIDVGSDLQQRKEDVLLYVGRLEEKQKKFSRIASVWRNIATKHQGWRLDVVGDGPDREAYEKQLEGCPRVAFQGFQKPHEFYRKSKILLMTSDFEGFPLVLAEAMSAGCVPIVLGSFSAVHDIIDGTNGIVTKVPFSEKDYADTVEGLMVANDKWEDYSKAARATAKKFSVAEVANEWERLFDSL